MSPGTELAAGQSRVIESHDRSDAIWNRNLAASFAIELKLDESLRSRDAALEMP